MPDLGPDAEKDVLPPPETVKVQHKLVRFEEAKAIMDSALRAEVDEEFKDPGEEGLDKQAYVDSYAEKHREKFGTEFHIDP